MQRHHEDVVVVVILLKQELVHVHTPVDHRLFQRFLK